MTVAGNRRFIFREEARDEATRMFGELVALSVLAIADTNVRFKKYSPVAQNADGRDVLTGPFVQPFEDMIEEVV